MRLEGDRVYLISHGFSPTVTIRMPDGSTITDTEAFVPSDASTLLSEGAFKEPGKPGAKQDVVVKAKFIRSTWFMLTSGKDVTIIAPVDDMQIMRGVLAQVGKGIAPEVRAPLKLPPHADIDALKMRSMRTTGDQVIIQGNNRGLTFSYPQATASYSSELKAVP